MVKALLAGISLIFAISAQAQNEFTIKGKISGLEDRMITCVIYLRSQCHGCRSEVLYLFQLEMQFLGLDSQFCHIFFRTAGMAGNEVWN